MRFNKVIFENFRSFKENTRIENIKYLTSFVGSNNSGKSNVIEVLLLLRSMVSNSWSKNYLDLTFDKKNTPIKIEIELELSDDERRKIIESIPEPNPIRGIDLTKNPLFKFLKYQATITAQRCVEEHLYVMNENEEFHILHYLWTSNKNNIVERRYVKINEHFINNGTIVGLYHLGLNGESNANSNTIGIFEPSGLNEPPIDMMISLMKSFLQNIRYFNPYRRASVMAGAGEQHLMTEDGNNVVSVMATILGNDTDEFTRIMNLYKEIVNGVKTVNVPPVGGNYTIKIKEEGLESQIDFANMSSGLHQALILLFAIEKALPNQVICIEEPEINLHASAQKRLLRFMLTKANLNQFFVTTHSSLFTGINNVHTYLVTKPWGSSQLMLVENEQQLKFIKQQLGIRNSDTFGNDYIIFVEGESEEIALPIVAKSLGFDDVGMESNKRIRIINLKGNGIIPNLHNFLDYLKNSDTGVFLIADADSKAGKAISDYIREGRILEDHQTVWDKEFEDTFDSAFIITAMHNICNRKGASFLLTVMQLDELRNKKKIGKILGEYIIEQKLGNFSKTEFAMEVATMISTEILSNESGRKKTIFESKINEFLDIIKKEDELIR